MIAPEVSVKIANTSDWTPIGSAWNGGSQAGRPTVFRLTPLKWTIGRNIGKTGFPRPFWQRSGLMAGASGVRRSELGDALRTCRKAFIGVGIMSCAINVLYLTGSIFMLEIYDRVLPSRSVPTLIGLGILAGGMYFAQGILDLIRGRILGRIGTALDEALNRRVFDTMVRLPLVMGARNEGLQPLRDL